ncbi:MAG: hypothetical protein PUP91_38220 [Rhizonema sp. PD37]|nr:hypothetical protein [Rhizonema sp. PD37]
MSKFNPNNERQHKIKATLLKNFVLEEFVNLFQDSGVKAMLLESEMEILERDAFRWVSAIVCYDNLGKQVKDEIRANSKQWSIFRDATGVIEVEIFTRPFADPKKCITRVDLKDLNGWNDSPVKDGIRPALIW